MPGMSGLDLQRRIKEAGIEIPIIFLSSHGDVPTAVEAVQQGAIDFIEKPVRSKKLLNSIRQAFDLDAQQRKVRFECDQLAAGLAMLTPREEQVVDLVMQGLNNKQIASRFGISSPGG